MYVNQASKDLAGMAASTNQQYLQIPEDHQQRSAMEIGKRTHQEAFPSAGEVQAATTSNTMIRLNFSLGGVQNTSKPMYDGEELSPLDDDEEQQEEDQDDEYSSDSPENNLLAQEPDETPSVFNQEQPKLEEKKEAQIVPPEPKRVKTNDDGYKPPSKPLQF